LGFDSSLLVTVGDYKQSSIIVFNKGSFAMSNFTNFRKLPQLVMCRENLNNLPDIRLPGGYSLTCFRSGYEKYWDVITAASFNRKVGETTFEKIMQNDPALKPERVLFIKYGNEFVATASAWFKPIYGIDTGSIHQVGVLPGHRGKHLGYWISLAALHRLSIEGFRKATLETDDYRIPAIKTYLKLGFVPMLVHENQRERWKGIFLECGCCEDFESRNADILSGPIHVFKETKVSPRSQIITIENSNETITDLKTA
jgi:mycothiol synthase